MAEEYIKAKTASTIPTTDGSHTSLEAGQPIAVSELSEEMQSSLRGEGSNADWTSRLFEVSSKEDYDAWQAGNRSIQTEFDRDRLNQLANITLPGPDEIVTYAESGEISIEKAPPVLPVASHTSSAVTVEGAEADEKGNKNVGTNDPSPPPVEGQVGLNNPEHEGDDDKNAEPEPKPKEPAPPPTTPA